MDSSKFEKFIDLWRDEYAIARTIDEQKSIDKNGDFLPWYTYPAIEYLKQFDYSGKKVWEFGCGYSCAFWAKRAKKVVAIEDNKQWFDKWNNEFDYENLKILLREENDNYENSLDETCDVIIVDGKRREQCAERALQYLSDDGFIIVDDSDRVNNSEDYQKMISLLKEAGLLQIDFYGCCPMNNFTKATSVFFRRNFNFPLCQKWQPANGIGNLWGKKRNERKKFYKNNK